LVGRRIAEYRACGPTAIRRAIRRSMNIFALLELHQYPSSRSTVSRKFMPQ
jgi:hypothetical protein